MARKSAIDMAIEDQKRNVSRAMANYSGFGILVQERILRVLKSAKRDKERLEAERKSHAETKRWYNEDHLEWCAFKQAAEKQAWKIAGLESKLSDAIGNYEALKRLPEQKNVLDLVEQLRASEAKGRRLREALELMDEYLHADNMGQFDNEPHRGSAYYMDARDKAQKALAKTEEGC